MLGAGLIATAVVYAPEIVVRRNVRLALQSGALATIVCAVVVVVVLTDTFSTGIADLWNVINPWSGHVFPLWSSWVAMLFLVGVVAALISIALDRSRARIVVFGVLAGLISTFAIVITVGLIVPSYLALTLPFWALTAATGWDAILRALAQIRVRAVRDSLLATASSRSPVSGSRSCWCPARRTSRKATRAISTCMPKSARRACTPVINSATTAR
jgi:hypothetical protein